MDGAKFEFQISRHLRLAALHDLNDGTVGQRFTVLLKPKAVLLNISVEIKRVIMFSYELDCT
jgi:hypothetical protein